MYQVPTPTRSFSKTACFFRVLGWFSLFGLALGIVYALGFELFASNASEDVRFTLRLLAIHAVIAGVSCGLSCGIATIIVLRNPTISWLKLALIYLVIILLTLIGVMYWLSFGTIQPTIEDIGILFRFIFLPSMLLGAWGVWIAKRILR